MRVLEVVNRWGAGIPEQITDPHVALLPQFLDRWGLGCKRVQRLCAG